MCVCSWEVWVWTAVAELVVFVGGKKKPILTATDGSMSHISSVTHQRLTQNQRTNPCPEVPSLPFTPQEIWRENYENNTQAYSKLKSFSTLVSTPGLSHGSGVPSKDRLWLNRTYSFAEISCRLMSRDERNAEKLNDCASVERQQHKAQWLTGLLCSFCALSLYFSIPPSFMLPSDSCGSAHWLWIKLDDYIPPKLSLHVLSMTTP